MRIELSKIEIIGRISGVGLRQSVLRSHCRELYFDTELLFYVMVREPAEGTRKENTVIIERGSVACAQVYKTSVPKFQPIGTPDSHDTPSGRKKSGPAKARAKAEAVKLVKAEKAEKAEKAKKSKLKTKATKASSKVATKSP